MEARIVKRMFLLLIISILFSVLFEFNEHLTMILLGMSIVCAIMYFVMHHCIRKINYDKILNEKVLKEIKMEVMNMESKMTMWLTITIILWILCLIFYGNFELNIYLNVVWFPFIFQLYFILYCIFNLRAIKKLQKEINRIK